MPAFGPSGEDANHPRLRLGSFVATYIDLLPQRLRDAAVEVYAFDPNRELGIKVQDENYYGLKVNFEFRES